MKEWRHRCETIRRKGDDFLTRVARIENPFPVSSLEWSGELDLQEEKALDVFDVALNRELLRSNESALLFGLVSRLISVILR